MKIYIIITLLISNLFAFYDTDYNKTHSNRFIPFEEEPSYMLFSQYSEDSKGKADETAIEANYAFEYILFDSAGSYEKCKVDRSHSTHVISFSYTGKFDFYINSFGFGRYSSPVINRKSNPAINYRYIKDENLYFGISAEHRSNGQVTDVNVKDSNGNYLTQIAYENKDHKYFDSLSRASNYISLKYQYTSPWFDNNKPKIYQSIKLYINEDIDVTWGNLAGSSVSIKDYDIVRTRVIIPIKKTTMEIDYTFGTKLLKTDSVDISMLFPAHFESADLPFYIRTHFGPMERLSDYTQNYKTVGVGLLFDY